MGTALGHIQHGAIAGTQFNTEPLTKRGRPRPQIDGHVVNRATYAAHQLDFGRRRQLKVHAPHRTATMGVGGAALRDDWVKTSRSELVLAERAGEVAPLVLNARPC